MNTTPMLTRTRTLTLFNPEHDLALGANEPHYILPASVRKMKEDLALLPIWYAPLCSEVLVVDVQQSAAFLALHPLSPLVSLATASLSTYQAVSAWGWNASLVKGLLQQGITAAALPTQRQLHEIRTLSGRKLAVEVLHALYPHFGKAESAALYTPNEVEAFVTGSAHTILKEPWSGSGRGLRFGTGLFTKSLEGWVLRTLRSQGYLVAEPFYRKVKDFAMEFYVSSTGISFVGYSIFQTDATGSYQRGLLGSNEYLLQQLLPYTSREALEAVQLQLANLLSSRLCEVYEGYLGVDMMICQEAVGTHWLHPCVEINLRMNMGLVARLVYDQYVSAGSVGYYAVAYEKEEGALLERQRCWQANYPLVLSENRLVSGYCPLTPITAATLYHAYVVLQEEGIC